MKELSMDELVLVAGGLKCGPGELETMVITGDGSGGQKTDPSKCDDV